MTDKLPEHNAEQHAANAAHLRDRGQHAAAVACVMRAYNLAPNDARVVGQVANVAATSGTDLELAVNMARECRRLDPELERASLHNEALAELHLGSVERAVTLLERAVALQPEDLGARWDLALARLTLELPDAWEHHEVRLLRPPMPDHLPKTPRWRGKKIDGQALWVYSEQGVGDIIQFSRYLFHVKQRCRKLIFSAPPALMSLFRGHPAVDELYAWTGYRDAPEPRADWSCPLLSLPLYCEAGRFGWAETAKHLSKLEFNPYLKLPDPARGERKVGLVWAGNPSHPNDRYRSVALKELLPLASVTENQMYSLQVGLARQELVTTGADLFIYDVGRHLDKDDWGPTLQVLRQLDALVTVDTGVAHLAGSLGLPTALLLPRNADWRWGRQERKTPWYPSLELFRQTRLGEWDWGSLFTDVYGWLRALSPTLPEGESARDLPPPAPPRPGS